MIWKVIKKLPSGAVWGKTYLISSDWAKKLHWVKKLPIPISVSKFIPIIKSPQATTVKKVLRRMLTQFFFHFWKTKRSEQWGENLWKDSNTTMKASKNFLVWEGERGLRRCGSGTENPGQDSGTATGTRAFSLACHVLLLDRSRAKLVRTGHSKLVLWRRFNG